MGQEEVAEPEVSELIFIGIVCIGATINVAVGRIRTGQVVPSGRETMLVMRGGPLNERATNRGSASRRRALSWHCGSSSRERTELLEDSTSSNGRRFILRARPTTKPKGW